jgi:hypothetical protein
MTYPDAGVIAMSSATVAAPILVARPSPHGKCAGATRVASDAGPDTSTFRMIDLLLFAFKGKKNLLIPLG